MKAINGTAKPAIWGGLECTINRVGETFTDQFELSGLYDDESRLESVLQLGLKAIRFPLLWEKYQPSRGVPINWKWADKQLSRLRDYNVMPIIGLLHHGSGPVFTHLLDENFPSLFAAYAAEVAARYPWVEYFTPVNEPLTTARFSGLYGLWFPHKKNDVSFVKMLLTELKATVLAMKAIRLVNPAAKLIQTDDLGKTYSTALLSYQAGFENERRWLTWDILSGKFTPAHKLWDYFMRLGITKEAMVFFIKNPCPPDIIGLNYYATSERYLDEDITNYPGHHVGGNTLHHYVDVEAVRIPLQVPYGPEVLIREAWDRYQIPLAITEVHLHCTREEQLRWLNDIYSAAGKLRNEGVDLRAVTFWALMGSYGWNKLLTALPFEYEPGAFDISNGSVTTTAIATFIKSLVKGTSCFTHLTRQPGWWKSPGRYLHKIRKQAVTTLPPASFQPLLIQADASGLSQVVSTICSVRNIHHFVVNYAEHSFDGESSFEAMNERFRPWGIINFSVSGFNLYADTEELTRDCKRHNIQLLTLCTGEVHKPGLSVSGRPKGTGIISFVDNCIEPSEGILKASGMSALVIKIGGIDAKIHSIEMRQMIDRALDMLIDECFGVWHLSTQVVLNSGSKNPVINQ